MMMAAIASPVMGQTYVPGTPFTVQQFMVTGARRGQMICDGLNRGGAKTTNDLAYYLNKHTHGIDRQISDFWDQHYYLYGNHPYYYAWLDIAAEASRPCWDKYLDAVKR
jgi:hypothetical protein